MRKDTWSEIRAQKVVAIDIDDTLSESTKFWINYVNEELGTDFKDLDVMKSTLSYNKYRKLKEKFRTSGVKKYIPPIPGASELTSALKDMGYGIVIITARPNKKYPGLSKVTTDWLLRNGIQYDAIIFDPDKHIRVLETFPNLSFSINDHFTEAALLAKWGYDTFLLDNEYNRRSHNIDDLPGNIVRVKSLYEIIAEVNRKEIDD